MPEHRRLFLVCRMRQAHADVSFQQVSGWMCINRVNGMRAMTIQEEVDRDVANARALPRLARDEFIPGLLEGRCDSERKPPLSLPVHWLPDNLWEKHPLLLHSFIGKLSLIHQFMKIV